MICRVIWCTIGILCLNPVLYGASGYYCTVGKSPSKHDAGYAGDCSSNGFSTNSSGSPVAYADAWCTSGGPTVDSISVTSTATAIHDCQWRSEAPDYISCANKCQLIRETGAGSVEAGCDVETLSQYPGTPAPNTTGQGTASAAAGPFSANVTRACSCGGSSGCHQVQPLVSFPLSGSGYGPIKGDCTISSSASATATASASIIHSKDAYSHARAAITAWGLVTVP